LSAEEVLALQTGKGMGLAKAAELNGYPGPAHVLQLASDLQLTAQQQAQTQTLFDAMEAKAIPLGKALVEKERALDQLFATGKATPKNIAAQLAAIGALQARLRGAHLEVHLAQTKFLQPAQMAKYAQLRGYAEKAQGDSRTQHHMH
jgi:Spy/CpxP family protein refolding chaperone